MKRFDTLRLLAQPIRHSDDLHFRRLNSARMRYYEVVSPILIKRFSKKRTLCLPTEICEAIIDCVAQTSRFNDPYVMYEDFASLETLKACSLTCRAWTPRTRIHLFRIVCVRCWPDAGGSIADFALLIGWFLRAEN